MTTIIQSETPQTRSDLIAIIDIGTTAIRLVIAEIHENSKYRVLDVLSQSVNIGHDTFTNGSISSSTTEECVNALKNFQKVLREYGIVNDDQIQAVATSAAREASNTDFFLNRIYIATGLTVNVIGKNEISRYLYSSILPIYDTQEFQGNPNVIVVEVGAGSTAVLVLQQKNIIFSRSFQFGSFRLLEAFEESDTPAARIRYFIESQIQHIVEEVKKEISFKKAPAMVIIGGDARIATSHISPEWNKQSAITISTLSLHTLANILLDKSVEKLVQQYHITFSESETLAPALLSYTSLAKAFNTRKLVISPYSMRDGIISEFQKNTSLSKKLDKQIQRSALSLGNKHRFDQKHAEHVAMLSLKLFKQLSDAHKLPSKYATTLYLASILHDIGTVVSSQAHHKHSMYIIKNSELFGVDHDQLNLIAVIARYHRKAIPCVEHKEFSSLNQNDQIIVSKLASILRISDALDRRHSQRINKISIEIDSSDIKLFTSNVSDISIEQLAMNKKAKMFEKIFGKKIQLKETS